MSATEAAPVPRRFNPPPPLAEPRDAPLGDKLTEAVARIAQLREGRARAVLDGAGAKVIAALDQQLAEARAAFEGLDDAEAEQGRRGRELADQAGAAARAAVETEIDAALRVRGEAVARAEEHCREMCSAIADALAAGHKAAVLAASIGKAVPGGLMGDSGCRWFGERISSVLRNVTNSPARFGGVMLQRTWRRADQVWADDGPVSNGEDNAK